MMGRNDELFIDRWSIAPYHRLIHCRRPWKGQDDSTDVSRRPVLELEARSNAGAHPGLRVDLGDAQQLVGRPPGALPGL